MNYTTEPNVKIGLYSDLDAIGEPMIAPEIISNHQTASWHRLSVPESACQSFANLVEMYSRHPDNQIHALAVMIDEKGKVAVYDSLAQRYGKSLDPDVELHRMMIIIALARCVPGFATYMGAMFEAMTQNGSKSIGKCPYDKMLSDAALAKAPAWLEDMYNEAVIFDV